MSYKCYFVKRPFVTSKSNGKFSIGICLGTKLGCNRVYVYLLLSKLQKIEAFLITFSTSDVTITFINNKEKIFCPKFKIF